MSYRDARHKQHWPIQREIAEVLCILQPVFSELLKSYVSPLVQVQRGKQLVDIFPGRFLRFLKRAAVFVYGNV